MAWLAVHENGEEGMFRCKPTRDDGCWLDLIKGDKVYYDTEIFLPKGTIKKILGRNLTWENEPVELK